MRNGYKFCWAPALASCLLIGAAGPVAAQDDRTYRPISPHADLGLLPSEPVPPDSVLPDPRRDEFGRLPDKAHDPDLALPDPFLDRTWPGPEPGGGVRPLDRDEAASDPFPDGEAVVDPEAYPDPYAEPEAGEEAEEGEEAGAPTVPPRPLIGPDGRADDGSPSPAADPNYVDPLDIGKGDSAGLQPADDLPSPLDQDDSLFRQEMSDPGDW